MNLYLKALLASTPIIAILIALGYFKIKAHIACAVTFVITFLMAIFIWQMPFLNAVTASLEGGALALWPIMIVIVAAVFTYNLSVYTGGMDTIKSILAGISSDKRIQVLIIAWGFGGFLEAVAGYGTAVAIPASILIALGFRPIFAAVICLIANTVPTAFGAIGIPITTLAEITNLNVMKLSYFAGLQLFPFIILIPFVLVIFTSGKLKGLKGVIGITFFSGLSFAVTELLAAKYMGAELPSLLGSISTMVVTIFMAKLFYKNKENQTSEAKEAGNITPAPVPVKDPLFFLEAILAWLPYILIFTFIILSSKLFPAISHGLSSIKSSVVIYTGENALPFTFKWIATPGVLIIIATFMAGIIQRVKLKSIITVLFKTIYQLKYSFLTIIAIVGLAKLMGYSGMIKDMAVVLAAITGSFYPFISPLLGAIGTFVTGSDTSSNVLFGGLQVDVAAKIGVDKYWLAAASGTGATAGKMISPQSIAVATAATDQTGHEGEILSKTMKFCFVYMLIFGILIFCGSLFL